MWCYGEMRERCGIMGRGRERFGVMGRQQGDGFMLSLASAADPRGGREGGEGHETM